MTRILLKGGCVLTLGAKSPNLRQGDVLIEDDVVSEVGTGLRARDAEPVDATDTIVMPGFVDTHRHAWRSLSRNVGAWPPGSGTSGSRRRVPARGRLRRHADRLAGRDRGGDHHRGRLVADPTGRRPRGLRAPGARRRGAANGVRPCRAHRDGGSRIDRAGDPASSWRALGDAAGPLTTIAFGSGVPDANDLERVAAEWAVARELGLRIHAHVDPETSGPGAIAELARRGLLGEDVTLVHCSSLDDEDVEAIAVVRSVGVARAVERDGGRSRYRRRSSP